MRLTGTHIRDAVADEYTGGWGSENLGGAVFAHGAALDVAEGRVRLAEGDVELPAVPVPLGIVGDYQN